MAAVAFLTATACATPTPLERQVRRTFADARQHKPDFARHFSRDMQAREIESYRRGFAQYGPPKFELSNGPWCIRAYWDESGMMISHSYYIYFAMEGEQKVIVSVEYDLGFRHALGSHHSGEPRVNLYDRCRAANRE